MLVIGKYTHVLRGIFLRGGRGPRERVVWEGLFMEEFFMGKRIFVKGVLDFPAVLKKKKKLNRKTSFFN